VGITPYSNQPSENKAVSLPKVNFTANLTIGKAPLSVLFTGNCTGIPTGFNWTFGDGTYSTHNLTAIHTSTKPEILVME
jgi:PKD repeat protein